MTPEYAANYMFDHIAKDARNRAICCGVDFTDQIKAILEKENAGEDIEEDFWKYVADVREAFERERMAPLEKALTTLFDAIASLQRRYKNDPD